MKVYNKYRQKTNPMYKNIFLISPYNYFYKNRILEVQEDYKEFEDRLYPDRTYPYFLLKEEFKKNGVNLRTYDYFDKNDKSPYALFFVDTPPDLDYFLKRHPGVDMFLQIYESPLYSFRNFNPENQKCFKKIFTWDSKVADGKTFFTARYANRIPKNVDFSKNKKEEFCLMISSHKLKTEPNELYTERVKAIEWFEKNAPQDLNLYGVGWDKYYFKDKLVKLNHLKFLTKLLAPKHPCYRGPAESKVELCKKHKFYICYENTIFPDYISEKIFDTFLAGCVPIYLGAPNITDYIPETTFIDKNKFESYEGLHKYLKNMPDQEYQNYLSEIKKFMQSEKIYPFTGECFAKTIASEILKNS
jgi:hypothetical protein